MQLSQENIDEWIFEYFEGNLSESDKSELLNFIHQNPEFEKDFVQWAQTYSHVEEGVPDYKLAKKLVRTFPVYTPLTSYLYGSIGLITFCIIALLFLKKDSLNHVGIKHFSNQPGFIESPLIPDVKQITIMPENKQEQIFKAKNTSPTEIKGNEISVDKSKGIPASPVTNLAEDKDSVFLNTELKIDNPVQMQQVKIEIQPDTISLMQPQALPKINLPTTKRRKLPLNLKPNPDFMPVNENF